MYRNIFKIGFVFGLILFAGNLFAQNSALKIGIVDVETIVKELPEAVDAENKLKSSSKNYQDTLLKMQKELEDKFQKYQKQKSMMPQEQQQKEEEAMNNLNTQILQYREQVFGTMGTIYQFRETLMEPIRKKVKASIEKIAKEEKMSFVIDKGNTFLLYSEDKFDITFRVLDHLKRGDGK